MQKLEKLYAKIARKPIKKRTNKKHVANVYLVIADAINAIKN